MYQVKFKDLNDAAKIMYCFMVAPNLTRPECTVWKDMHTPLTITNLGKGFMLEDAFCQLIASSGFEMVICVASSDKTDKRRVVLAMMPGMNYMKLSFPQSDGKLNAAERRLIRVLNNV